jgi:hypothetical protein
MIPNPKKPGKLKKVKKQVPAYIPSHDADILARARKSAYRLDFSLFNFLGFRFGWSSVIGIVPVVGDAADGSLSLLLINRMRKVEGGLPQSVLIMMLFNFLLDFLVGLIPFVGDLADASFKCNSKNVRLLEQHLDKVHKPQQLVDQEARLPRDQRPRPATVYEDFSDEEEDRRNTFNDAHEDVRHPTRAHSGRIERQRDEEMGLPVSDARPSRNEGPSRHATKSSRR